MGDTPVLGTSNDTITVKADDDQSLLVRTKGQGATQISSEKSIQLNSTGTANTEVEPIEIPYGLFDYDQKARERINIAMAALNVQGKDASITWTLADNTTVVVTADIFNDVILLVAKRSNELHTKYRELADKVNDCTNADEIRSINWD